MAARLAALALVAAVAAGTSGCAGWRDPIRSVGAVVEDRTIADTVRARLAATRDLDASGIEVRVVGGDVVLAGTSATALAKSTAESVALKVPGVTSVRNEVSVRP